MERTGNPPPDDSRAAHGASRTNAALIQIKSSDLPGGDSREIGFSPAKSRRFQIRNRRFFDGLKKAKPFDKEKTSALRGGMISIRDGKNNRGGEPMSHADVVISNVTYEVSRVFSGSRSMKDLPMSQIKE